MCIRQAPATGSALRRDVLPEEARWIGDQLCALPGCDGVVLNIGSSTGAFTTVTQPWIHRHVFAKLEERGQRVLNIDRKAEVGVNLTGDICDPEFQARVAALGGSAILATNLLEHVPDPGPLAAAFVALVPPGGYLVISGPYSYPWHPDPIDSKFRPTVEELAGMFAGTKLVAGAIVPSGTYYDWLGRSPWKLAGALLKLLNPFRSARWWWADVLKLGWIFRPFSATCIVLRKGDHSVR
jgi:SAM-dependent methyltransferase